MAKIGADKSGLEELLALSRSLGSSEHRLSILAEGNVSTLIDEDTFWVKASGAKMGEASADSFVRIRFAPILAALSGDALSDSEVKSVLTEARTCPNDSAMPSVETFMHAYLLKLPDVSFVGHTHPTPLLSILCLQNAETFAKQRLFPDEVVCCGPESAFVPYTDPGLTLARAICSSVESYAERWGSAPKTIWIQNHGLIALGNSRAQVESATFMTEKSAEVWLGVLSSNRPPNVMSEQQVARIHNRPDEHYRQRLLWKFQQEAQ